MSGVIIPDTSTTLLRDVADATHARWAEFYSRYRPMMSAFLNERFPVLEAEDIIQETFVALSKIIPDYCYEPEEKGAFHNFLTGVLRNKALCALDARQRTLSLEKRMQLFSSLDDRSVHEQSYHEWREALFQVALKQLLADETIHDRTKEAFVRTAIKGESIEQVAESMGVVRNTVDAMRSRVMAKLQDLVERLKGLC